MKKKIVYIINPVAGKLSQKNKKRIIDSIDPSSEPEIIFSKSAEDAGKRAHKFMSKRYLVVACGGDGFINEFNAALYKASQVQPKSGTWLSIFVTKSTL